MNFHIILFEGTDSIKFGMTHDEIQKLLGKKPTLFKKTIHDLHMTEDYSDVCHVYYDGVYSVAFEFYSPSQVFFNDIALIGKNRTEIEPLFMETEGYTNDTEGFRIHGGDVGFYAPNGIIESVYLSRKGYYEEELAYYTKLYS